MNEQHGGTGGPTSGEQTAEERHATWIELFFDLVVVAGVGTLAHVVHEDVTWRSVGLYALLFLAFWLSWTSFMLYGNAAGEAARTRRMLAGMFGMAVMAAAAPGVAADVLHDGFEGSHFAMANAFAIAYFVTRLLGAGAWRRGVIVGDWPIAQQITGAVPWLVSVWVDEPWKFALWLLGIVIDVVLLVVVSGQDLFEDANERMELIRRREAKRPNRGRDRNPRHDSKLGDFAGISMVTLDSSHLAERLGLFVIIVLGEGVIQGVTAASGAEWDGHLFVAGAASFVLLAAMWALSVVHGFAGVPHLRAGAVPQRVGLAFHCIITASIAAAAASLGSVVAHGSQELETPHRWLLCGAMALYFAVALLAGILSGVMASWRLAVWTLVGIGLPIALAAFNLKVSGTGIVIWLAITVYVHVVAERIRERRVASAVAPA